MKFIHAADIHLDSPLHRLETYEGAPVAEIRNASRRAFQNLIALALGEAVDFVLIAGDLFDGEWKDYNTGLFFVNQVRRLNDARIPVFIVSGNHDAAGRITAALPYPENVMLFSHRQAESHTLDHLHAAIHGRSFAAPAVTENLAATYPEPLPGHFNIGLLHTSVTGRQGHAPYAPCTVGDLTAKGYDYWALGHVHQFERVADEPPAVFPGCIQGRHIRETGAKGCALVTVEPGGGVQVGFRALDVVRWVRLDVDVGGCTTRAHCLERLQVVLPEVLAEHDPLPVVLRVGFTGVTAAHGAMSADPEAWAQAVRAAAMTVGGGQVWIEKVHLLTRTPSRGGDLRQTAPMRELSRYLDALGGDEAALAAAGGLLDDLYRKLPLELRRGEAVPRPDDPEALRRLLDEAGAMLMQRLGQEASDQ